MEEAKTHPQTMTFAVIAFLSETAATEVVSMEHSSWVAAPLSFSAFALFAITLFFCHHFIHFSRFHYKQLVLAVARCECSAITVGFSSGTITQVCWKIVKARGGLMSCSSSFCSTSHLLSSAECDIFLWHLIHRALLLILCTEFSCCVIWGQRLLQQPARRSAHPSALLLLQRKGGWDEEISQTRNKKQASKLVQDV